MTFGNVVQPLALSVPFGYSKYDNNGVSRDAIYLRGRADSFASTNRLTYLKLKRESVLLKALIDAVEMALEGGWDGYESEMVLPQAILSSARFIEVLPFDVPLPEVSVEPDGEIAFDWQGAVDRIFSVSLGENQKMSYSGVFGDEDLYGSAFFVESLPRNVLRAIQKVYDVV